MAGGDQEAVEREGGAGAHVVSGRRLRIRIKMAA